MPPEVASFAPQEVEALQELLNIAFGRAAADLAEAVGEPIELSVPDVQLMPAVLLRYYIAAELKDQARLEVVEQAYLGDLQGIALLVLPEALPASVRAAAERILVGACLERLAHLLGTATRLEPAAFAVEDRRTVSARAERAASGAAATVLRARFGIGTASGYLFLASGAEAAPWLRGALQRFLAQVA
jgi:chemotaxis protein CheC